jgi:hypothetical protein
VKSGGAPIESCRNDDASFENDIASFKPFADSSKSEKSSVVMKGEVGKDQKTEVIYKVNIPPSQATGSYENTVTYFALPSF